MFEEHINDLHRKYISTLDEILESKLRLIGFTGRYNVEDIRRFINENHIEILMENKPMFTTYIVKDKITRNELFRISIKTSILKEDDRYLMKTEFLDYYNIDKNSI